ncbi:hypothetical protein DRQ50_14085, partial [bacterium]
MRRLDRQQRSRRSTNMRITPLDVRKQEFRRSVRGFDCDEVRAF